MIRGVEFCCVVVVDVLVYVMRDRDEAWRCRSVS